MLAVIRTATVATLAVALCACTANGGSAPDRTINESAVGCGGAPLSPVTSPPPTADSAYPPASKDDLHNGYAVGRDQWAAILTDECAPLPTKSEITDLCSQLYGRLPSTGSRDPRSHWVTGCVDGVTDGYRTYH